MALTEAKRELSWDERYRPRRIDELLVQTQYRRIFSSWIKDQNTPHLIFSGPPGSGKTSAALVLSDILSDHTPSLVLTLNASDERSLDTVRHKIIPFAAQVLFGQNVRTKKVVVLDEADAWGKPVQNLLRVVMEKYAKTTRFIFTCNELHEIIGAVRSRCSVFRFAGVSAADVRARLQHVAADVRARLQHVAGDQGVACDPESLDAIVHVTQGDLRAALSLLQCTLKAHKVLTPEHVYQCAGRLPPSVLDTLCTKLWPPDEPASFRSVFSFVQEKCLQQRGVALEALIDQLEPRVYDHVPLSHQARFVQQLHGLQRRMAMGARQNLQVAALVGLALASRSVGPNQNI